MKADKRNKEKEKLYVYSDTRRQPNGRDRIDIEAIERCSMDRSGFACGPLRIRRFHEIDTSD